MKNPTPKQAKVMDYFEHPDGYKRKYIVHIFPNGKCDYDTYYLEDYEVDRYTRKLKGGKWVKSMYDENICSLSHLRRWSLVGNR